MSTGIDIQFVRENYQRMTDAELIQSATTDAVGLTPEALEVVKEEISVVAITACGCTNVAGRIPRACSVSAHRIRADEFPKASATASSP
jgi:hypothetical protein